MGSVFSRFKRGILSGADAFQAIFSSKKELSEEDLETLEEAFYSGDLGVETTNEIVELIRNEYSRKKNLNSKDVIDLARKVLFDVLEGAEGELSLSTDKEFSEILCLVGVNGSGKI